MINLWRINHTWILTHASRVKIDATDSCVHVDFIINLYIQIFDFFIQSDFCNGRVFFCRLRHNYTSSHTHTLTCWRYPWLLYAHHAVTKQPASAAQHCGIPLGSVLRMSTLRERLQRAIAFKTHTNSSSSFLTSAGWQLTFCSSQLRVIHDDCVTFALREREWCFCWINICASGIRRWYEWYTRTITMDRSGWIVQMLKPVTHAAHHQTTEPPSSHSHLHFWLRRGSHTLYASECRLSIFVCKQDIKSHGIVLVLYQSVCHWVSLSLVYVCVMVWYSSVI